MLCYLKVVQITHLVIPKWTAWAVFFYYFFTKVKFFSYLLKNIIFERKMFTFVHNFYLRAKISRAQRYNISKYVTFKGKIKTLQYPQHSLGWWGPLRLVGRRGGHVQYVLDKMGIRRNGIFVLNEPFFDNFKHFLALRAVFGEFVGTTEIKINKKP